MATLTGGGWFWEIASRSCLLLILGFALERIFHSNRTFRSRLWFGVFIALIVIFIPLPAVSVHVLSSRTSPIRQSRIYELDPEFRHLTPYGPASKIQIPVLALLGAAALIGFAAWSFRGLRTWRLIRRSEQCSSSEAIASVYELSERLGLSEAPLILLSDEIESPCVAGIFNPVLLLPTLQGHQVTGQEWNVMVTHELHHLRANDHLRIVLTDLVAAVYWWNPLAWMGHRRARLAFEMECDQRASQTLDYDKAIYARTLMSGQAQSTSSSQVRFWNRGSTLKRIRGLSSNSTSRWPSLSLILFLPVIVPIQLLPKPDHNFDPTRIGLNEVVFCSRRPGNQALFRMFYDGSRCRQMPHAFVGASYPSISPDGTRIAYVKEESGQRHIFVADTSGTNERRVIALTERDDQPMFSPDGQQLLFMSFPSGHWKLGVHNLTTNRTRFLDGDSFKGYEARWHPSGSRILLSANRTGYQKIWSVNLDGTDLIQLTHGDFDDTGGSYSPDGRFLLYTSRQPNDLNIFKVDLLTGETQQLTTTIEEDTEVRPAADGKHLFFTTARTGKPEIASMNSDGSDQAVLTDQGDFGWPVCRN